MAEKALRWKNKLGGRFLTQAPISRVMSWGPSGARNRRRSWSWTLGVCVVLLLSPLAFPTHPTVPTLLVPHGQARHGLAERSRQGPGSRATSSTVLHDLTVTASNSTTLAGFGVNFTAAINGTTSPVSTTWWWGDGTTSVATSNPGEHVFQDPGIYLVYAEGTDAAGHFHDNLLSVLHFAVLNSYTRDALGNEAEVGGSVVANTTTSTDAQAVLRPGGLVEVQNWVTNVPADPQWVPGTPSYVLDPSAARYVNVSASLLNSSGLSGTTLSWSSSTPPGSYWINFTVPTMNGHVSPQREVWNNFTFTVIVSAGASATAAPVPTSPHNGTLVVYQIRPPNVAGNVSLDPALVDYSGDASTLQDIYQTLIVYNGSKAGPDPTDFVPDLATCVPGSAQCTALYGSSLVQGDNYTFVLDPNATFYNATTGGSASVRPNDVAFSIARSCAVVDLALQRGFVNGGENYPLCQALLPFQANGGWDGGLHDLFNNTPAHILRSMVLNSSTYCTPRMEDGIHGNGCVTFDTAQSSPWGWPDFLEFLAGGFGADVMSCSWATAEGLGLPGWSSGSNCLPAPPGSPGNSNPVPSDQAWDSYELASFSGAGASQTPLSYHAVGSGPYDLVSFDPASGLTLQASPVWGGTYCAGGALEGCLPAGTSGGRNPTYIPTVHVAFESSDRPGLTALAGGGADLADVLGNLSTAVSEVLSGTSGLLVGPSLGMTQQFFALEYNSTAAGALMGSPSTLPRWAMQDLDFRQFLLEAFPHLTYVQDQCVVDGILTCFSMGGVIPVGVGDYYPTNISWPMSNADTNSGDVGGAAWWWSQTQGDGLVGQNCTSSIPCTFPLTTFSGAEATFGETIGWPDASVMQAWAQAIQQISGGAIRPTVVMIPWGNFGGSIGASPGNASAPVWGGGWLPDYFDPTDFVPPYLEPNSSYPYPMALAQELSLPQYGSTCSGPASDPVVSTTCQGTAYRTLWSYANEADNGCFTTPSCPPAQRALLYNMAERITAGLGLFSPLSQTTATYVFAPWIDPSSLELNPDRYNAAATESSSQPFWMVQYRTTIPPGYHIDISTPRSSGTHSNGTGSPTLETGEAFLTLVSVTGGTGSYQFSWTGLPGGCSSVDSPALSCSPQQVGTFSVRVLVTDSHGSTGLSGPIQVAVIARPSISSFTIMPGNIALGGSIALSLVATGGIGPLTYSYLGLPPGCTSANTTTLSCTPANVGHYSVVGSVTDPWGFQAFAAAQVNVSATSGNALTGVQLAPLAASIAARGSVALTAIAEGSQGPLAPGAAVFSWSLRPAGMGSLNATGGAWVTFSAGLSPGGVGVVVNVTYGGITHEAFSEITISVGPPASSGGGSTGFTGQELVGFSVGAALLGLLIGLNIRLSRRKRRRTETRSPQRPATIPSGEAEKQEARDTPGSPAERVGVPDETGADVSLPKEVPAPSDGPGEGTSPAAPEVSAPSGVSQADEPSAR